MAELTQKRVRELFNYNSLTGELIWKVKGGNYRKAKKGESAGRINRNYLETYIDNKQYTNHRIIWLYVYGILTTLKNGLEIDHIDIDPSNNKLSNLRLTNKFGNSKNKNLRIDNTSKITGVNWACQRNEWLAKINTNNKSIFLGRYSEKINAVQARFNAELKYNWPIENSTSRKYLVEKGLI